MNKFWNWVRNEDTGTAELIFNGPISEDTWFGDEITPAMFRNELSKVSGDLTVWLNSPGGDVFAASQIYTMLRNHKGKVTVKIDGIAVGDNASAANIRKVFDIEGAEKLVSCRTGFSPDNVEVNSAAPESGNVKFTVTPKKGNGEKPDSFFFRVKMK